MTEFESKNRSETQSFQANMVVNGAGRVPDTEDLCFEKAGVKINKGAILVDRHLQTSNAHIYAGGDCALEGMQLTSVAKFQGEIAATNILNENSFEADYTGIPSAVHTIPVMALVRISDTKDINDYKLIFRDRNSWETTKIAGIEFAASKVILDEANDRIVGAHIRGPHAEETINIFAVLMRLRLKASDIQKMIFTYPAACFDIPYMI